MIIKLDKWGQVALGAVVVSWGVQTWGGLKLAKINDQLIETNKRLHENGNRAAYLYMYLLVKLAENDVELTEFDKQVMYNPPKLIDVYNPNLFSEFLEKWEKNGFDEDTAREFLNQLKQVREED